MPFNVTVEAESILKTFDWCFTVHNCSKVGTPTCDKVIVLSKTVAISSMSFINLLSRIIY